LKAHPQKKEIKSVLKLAFSKKLLFDSKYYINYIPFLIDAEIRISSLSKLQLIYAEF
jgi:hypothetical protein